MGVSKVDLNGETLIDLTEDTVNPNVLVSGYTAHNAAGEPVVGAVTTVPTTTSLAVTEEGVSSLDGSVGKVLNDKIIAQNDDFAQRIDEINNNLGGFSFGTTADGKPGYRKPGADTVIPFSSGIKPVYGSFRQSTALKTGNHYITVSFGQTFPSVPTVYIQPTDPDNGNRYGIRCITNVTTTDFTFLYSIGSGGTYRPKLNWIAWV